MFQANISHTPATEDRTPKALKLSGHDRHMAALEEGATSYKALVKRALQCIDTADWIRDKLAEFFIGKTADEVRDLLLPEVAVYYGCPFKTAKSSGRKMLATGHPASERATKALQRLVGAIVGEQNAHSQALEEAEAKAEKAKVKGEESPEPSEALIAAMASLIKKAGADRRTIAKAVSKAFALLK